eukprot:CAMPEP_0172164130 /NCGR_PEP_ID=MMETSP1050-20130122/7672_1 /TAXON_ID=233186 /ORGANISM="Cryptomonas curvata, Strain CCAP979/52" /LENGTH=205 /DNA_ID=CAMNT_0012834429 /DNA_START=187 /DNA_END=801 /DNA_ORIENTATION=+
MTPEDRVAKLIRIGFPIAVTSGLIALYYWREEVQKRVPPLAPHEHTQTNWSGTRAVSTKRFFQPETLEELESLVAHAHRSGSRLRPVGAGLSPNGLAFDKDGMVSLAHLDKVLSIDPANRRITVQAGARVTQVLEALRGHGLTLQNLASINEQHMGGFVQVSAHGTGAGLPPVDEQVVAMKLVTPALGTLSLSADSADPADRALF